MIMTFVTMPTEHARFSFFLYSAYVTV